MVLSLFNGVDKAICRPRGWGAPKHTEYENCCGVFLDWILMSEGSILDPCYEIWEELCKFLCGGPDYRIAVNAGGGGVVVEVTGCLRYRY
jgi:hypothetical protein